MIQTPQKNMFKPTKNSHSRCLGQPEGIGSSVKDLGRLSKPVLGAAEFFSPKKMSQMLMVGKLTHQKNRNSIILLKKNWFNVVVPKVVPKISQPAPLLTMKDMPWQGSKWKNTPIAGWLEIRNKGALRGEDLSLGFTRNWLEQLTCLKGSTCKRTLKKQLICFI